MLLFSLKDAEKGVPIPILRKEVVTVLILIVSASHGHNSKATFLEYNCCCQHLSPV